MIQVCYAEWDLDTRFRGYDGRAASVPMPWIFKGVFHVLAHASRE